MEIITGYLTAKVVAYVGGSIVAFILGWILKRIPNEKIKMVVGGIAYKLGVIMTIGLSKWKYTGKYWNKTVEPFFIDLVDNVIGEGVKQFIKGLRSDNSKIANL